MTTTFQDTIATTSFTEALSYLPWTFSPQAILPSINVYLWTLPSLDTQSTMPQYYDDKTMTVSWFSQLLILQTSKLLPWMLFKLSSATMSEHRAASIILPRVYTGREYKRYKKEERITLSWYGWWSGIFTSDIRKGFLINMDPERLEVRWLFWFILCIRRCLSCAAITMFYQQDSDAIHLFFLHTWNVHDFTVARQHHRNNMRSLTWLARSIRLGEHWLMHY